MTVVRYEPWALVSRLQKEIDRLFGAPLTTAADSGAWLPPVDIHEEGESVRAARGSAGRRSEGGGNHLRSGRADHSRTARGHRARSRARASAASSASRGEFQRRFSLPETADAQNIKAKVANGVLEVAIPKLAQVQPHRITVEAA